jgi:chorismate mutase
VQRRGIWKFYRPSHSESITVCLIALLQVFAQRRLGKFVSESKFRSCPADFVPHILTPNPSKLEELITKPEVEAALLIRLEKKAQLYGAEIDAKGNLVPKAKGKMKIDVDEVVKLYRDRIIPLTKDVEVRSVSTGQ